MFVSTLNDLATVAVHHLLRMNAPDPISRLNRKRQLALQESLSIVADLAVVFFASRSLDPHRKRSLGRSYVTAWGDHARACAASAVVAAVPWPMVATTMGGLMAGS